MMEIGLSMKKILRRFVYSLTCFSILLLFGARFIKHAFGKVTLEQIFFHLSVKPNFVPKESIFLAIKAFAMASCAIIIYTIFYIFIRDLYTTKVRVKNFIVCIKNRIRSFFLVLYRSAEGIFLFLSCVFCFIAFNYTNKNYNLIDYITAERSTFIEKNYHSNNFQKIKFSQKNNLILLFLESMEEQFCNQSAFEQNLIPELINLKQKGTSFKNNIQTIGTQYTFAGVLARLNGIPHFTPINIYRDRNYTSVLPGSQNILTLLQKKWI